MRYGNGMKYAFWCQSKLIDGFMILIDIYHFIFILFRYCDGGELFHYIIEKKYLSEDVAAYIMKQLFSALEYLHSKKISHRDIKPENFMLYKKDDMTCIKMIDFGLSKDFT